MKNLFNKVFVFILLAAGLLAATSCKKSFFTDVNDNPNAPDPSKITPNVLLPTVEGTLAYSLGGLSRYSSLLTQQTIGLYSQAAAYYQYSFTTNDFDNDWGNMYTSVLENNFQLMQISDKKGYNEYSGISRILMAYSLQIMVDNWGSLPYSQALQGDNMLQPAFDTDKGLYDTAVSLLDKGISQLNNPDAGILTPGIDDFIYGGNAGKWIKFAHAVKARLYIHQSKNNAAMANKALAEIALSFTSNADNAQFMFTTVETASNPWYQFNQQRGLIGFVESPLGESLSDNNDPRYPIFMNPDVDADGIYTDVNGVGMGPYYGNVNSPVEFIANDELLFMKAEATLRATGNVPEAETYYAQAINSNLLKLGVAEVDRDAYLLENGVLPLGVNDAIAKVASEEYIALFLNPEAWTLYRRTGSPALSVIGNDARGIPRRLLYGQTEYSGNAAHTPKATLYTPRIFWDN